MLCPAQNHGLASQPGKREHAQLMHLYPESCMQPHPGRFGQMILFYVIGQSDRDTAIFFGVFAFLMNAASMQKLMSDPTQVYDPVYQRKGTTQFGTKTPL